MKRILRTLTLILLLVALPVTVMAQSANDAYSKGVTMMNSGNYSGAIAQFKASKKLDKSPSNASRCNAKIKECQDAMKKKEKPTPRQGSSSGNRRNNGGYSSSNGRTAELGFQTPNDLKFAASPQVAQTVVLSTTSTNWSCEVEADGREWCHARKITDSDDGWQRVEVSCDPSERTSSRCTRVAVMSQGGKEYINVSQEAGAFVQLYIDRYAEGEKILPTTRNTEKNIAINISKKKGMEQIVITFKCNADRAYDDGYGNNWTVTSMPAWCKRKTTKKLYDTGGDKVKNFVKNLGKKQKAVEVPAENDELVFEVEKITDNKLMQIGRIGKIEIESYGQKCVVDISQTMK